MKGTAALVLAAGKGTRMHSDLPKVLHPICGRPMLSYLLATLGELGLARVLVVVGHQAERIKKEFSGVRVQWVLQSEQLGTAHAVMCALPHLSGFRGNVLICCGDTPLLSPATLRTFIRTHVATARDLSVLSAILQESGSYGRILRDTQGRVQGIVEAGDASKEELDIAEVNSGIYCASAELLQTLIPLIDRDNVQGEYYLTDMLKMAVGRGFKVEALPALDAIEVLGVNTREELAAAALILGRRGRR